MRQSVFQPNHGRRSTHIDHEKKRLVGFVSFAAFAFTLCSLTQAFAQAEAEPAVPPPAKPTNANVAEASPPTNDQRPLPPPPPRAAATSGGTGYNPQTNYNSGYPRNYYPPAPPSGTYRPFSFSFGIGPGLMAFRNDDLKESAGGVAYSVRFGFGVQPKLSITLGFDGSSAQLPSTNASQSALVLGVQYFIAQVLYLRAGMGLAHETDEDKASGLVVDQDGLALQGGVGVDLIQASNLSLALEAGVLVGHYAGAVGLGDENWTSLGLNLVFSLY